MNFIYKKLFLNFIVLVFFSSCAQNFRTWQYEPNTYSRIKSKTNKTVSVLVFEDRLNDKGISTNYIGLSLLPLVPFSTAHSSTPGEGIKSMHHDKPKGGCIRQTDTGETMTFNPAVSFSYTLFKELETSNLFKDVNYICNIRGDNNSDYIIRAYVKERSIDTVFYSYGLGFINYVVPLPWMFGLPVNKNTTNLSIEIEIVDVKKQNVVFKKLYTAKPISVLNGFYYSNSAFNFQEMIQEINLEFVNDFELFLKNKP